MLEGWLQVIIIIRLEAVYIVANKVNFLMDQPKGYRLDFLAKSIIEVKVKKCFMFRYIITE